MATVKEIAEDIKRTYGSSFVNSTQARRYLGMGKEKGLAFLADLPCYPTGKERKYHVLDVARRMDEIRTYIPYG